ncbi:hypothetical protein [Streptomyces sp. GS7]|nr:hypothetical protein [Streptomyces sp. GS7]
MTHATARFLIPLLRLTFPARGRRRALWCAVHGVGAGPRRIHGVEVVG